MATESRPAPGVTIRERNVAEQKGAFSAPSPELPNPFKAEAQEQQLRSLQSRVESAKP